VDALPWSQPGWRERAEGWIAGRIAALGSEPSGSVREVKLRPWSAVLAAPTTGGDVYFKANLPALANEPALTRVLARIDPEHVVPVAAEEPGERWMLQPDGGPLMRDRLDGGDVLGMWVEMIGLYGRLQVHAAAHVDDMLAAGAPDRRLGTLPGLYERLAAAEPGLPRSDESFSAEEHERLLGLAGVLCELTERLDTAGVPASIDHSDLHAGNVLAPDSGYAFFDWHEGAVTHPFFSMTVVMRSVAHSHGFGPGSVEAGRIRDAYLDAWAGHGSPAALCEAFDLALRVGPLTRALGWMRVVEGLPRPELARWAEYVPGWLRELQTELERP